MKELILNKRFEFVKNGDSVTVTVDGKPFRDSLSYNLYHDVYHICFAFYIDWSPCMIMLLDPENFDAVLGCFCKLEEALVFFCSTGVTNECYTNEMDKAIKAIVNITFGRPRFLLEADWQAALTKAWELEVNLFASEGGVIIVNENGVEYETR